jgi:RHS repeat-associated protein
VDGEFVEYRYDALGRRVYVDYKRTDTAGTNKSVCIADCGRVQEYSVWDGDQLLFEQQTKAPWTIEGTQWVQHGWIMGIITGKVGDYKTITATIPGHTITVQYTHGMGIDQPLSFYRAVKGDSLATVWVDPKTEPPCDNIDYYLLACEIGYWRQETIPRAGVPQLVIPHRNSQGAVFQATNIKGDQCCGDAYFPGDAPLTAHLGDVGLPSFFNRTFGWYGSLTAGSADANGLMYMRNRYYNPDSGQFTQPDPIGIAGGLNVYGYAAGDPVNYSDPFGLCATESAEEADPDDHCWEIVGLLRHVAKLATGEGLDPRVFDESAQDLERFTGKVLRGPAKYIMSTNGDAEGGYVFGCAPVSGLDLFCNRSDMFVADGQSVAWVALTAVHESGHLVYGLGHGAMNPRLQERCQQAVNNMPSYFKLYPGRITSCPQ